MSDLKLSEFLLRVLGALKELDSAVSVDEHGRPDPVFITRLARRLGENTDDVAAAVEGLRVSDCLMEESVEFEGAQPLTWWRVHPQC